MEEKIRGFVLKGFRFAQYTMEEIIMTDDIRMEDLMAQTTGVKTGSLVDGIVVSQDVDHFLIDVGLKQEAYLPIREFQHGLPKIGDSLPIVVLTMRGPDGRPLVSHQQAREKKHWDAVHDAFKNHTAVQGKIVKRVKGGVIVDVGIDAFMPTSQIDLKPVFKPEEWIGQSVKVYVLEMNRAKSNVLVSRRQLIEAEREVKKTETLKTIKEGQVVRGRVVSVTNFGAFLDIGGMEGLLHVSDLEWTRVEDPKTVVKVGDELDVQVLKFDTATHKVSLGRKQLLKHPWDGIEERFSIGTIVQGKVTGLASFGAFVQIEPGVEGLIHVSEISWTERVKNLKDVFKIGQEIEAKLIGFDREQEKISLSLKRLGASPWEQAVHIYRPGTEIEGDVTHTAPFGVFVKIPIGIEGLIKAQDLSWTDKAVNPQEAFKPGDKVKAVVLEVNVKDEKMSLGIKQLSKDPLKTLKVGDAVTGKVSKMVDFGVFVQLDSGLEGLVRSQELYNEKSIFSDGKRKGEELPSELPQIKEGDEITATVIKILKKDRKIELSIRKYEREQEKELLRKYSGQQGNPTIGEATGWSD